VFVVGFDADVAIALVAEPFVADAFEPQLVVIVEQLSAVAAAAAFELQLGATVAKLSVPVAREDRYDHSDSGRSFQ
jgi:hypothetical protein